MMMTPLASKHGGEEDEREKWDGFVLCSCSPQTGWLVVVALFARRLTAFRPTKPPCSTRLNNLYTSIVGIAAI